jgi:hypothetical protein
MIFTPLFNEFISGNPAARVLAEGLKIVGVGFLPVVDYAVFRTRDIAGRAREFSGWGFRPRHADRLTLKKTDLAIYRCPGCPALIFERPKNEHSLTAEWIDCFGEGAAHRVGVRVEDIDRAVFYLEKQGVRFSGKVSDDPARGLRQTFAFPAWRSERPYTWLELIERHGTDTFLKSHFELLIEEEAAALRRGEKA